MFLSYVIRAIFSFPVCRLGAPATEASEGLLPWVCGGHHKHCNAGYQSYVRGTQACPHARVLQLDLSWLPTSLESLVLKFFSVACPTFHGRLCNLRTLGLTYCRLGCMSHFQVRMHARFHH